MWATALLSYIVKAQSRRQNQDQPENRNTCLSRCGLTLQRWPISRGHRMTGYGGDINTAETRHWDSALGLIPRFPCSGNTLLG
jgi:hypothetical protein